MNGNCGECDRRWYCDIDPADCDKQSEPVPTNFEKIKEQIAAASVEEFSEILVDPDALFCCSKCELFEWRDPATCDFECENHCINWLNSEFKEGEK